MPKLNENYQNLKESYLFVEIAHRVAKYAEANPDKKIIRLGIGDVTLPLEPLAVEGLHEGVDAMTSTESFKGYGPEQGYDFLRQAVVDYYAENGVSFRPTMYLFLTEQKATQEILAIYLQRTTLSLSRIQFIQFMSTLTL